MDNPVILFDGVCNLCNSSVQFIIKRDRDAVFRFASLQSGFGMEKMKYFGMDTGKLDTLLLYESGKIYTRSTAALRIARRLKWPWKMFYVFIVVPPPVRNLIYNFVSRNRYKWFGRKDQCMIPTPELKHRFVE